MITWMQRHKKWLVITIWISTIAFVGAGFVGWGSYEYGKKGGVAAVVADREISQEELNQEYTNIYNQYQRMFGNSFNDEMADKMGLKQAAYKQVIQKNLILAYGDSLGLDVTDEDIARELVKYPAFLKDGKFDKATYEKVLLQNRTTIRDFEESLKRGILLEKITSFFQINPGKVEIDNLNQLLFLQDDINIKVLNANDINIEINEDELKKYWEKNKNAYMSEVEYEVQQLDFPLVSSNSSDEDIKKHYDKFRGDYRKEDGKIKTLEEAKADVIKDLDKKFTKREALKRHVKVKKGQEELPASKRFKTSDLPYTDENDSKITSAKTGTVIKPFFDNDKYVIVKVVKKHASQPLAYEAAKELATADFSNVLESKKLDEMAKAELKTFTGRNIKDVSRESMDKITELNPQEAVKFLSDLFSSTTKEGIVKLADKVVLYRVNSSKLGTVDSSKNEAVKSTLIQLQDQELMQNLVKNLENTYEVQALEFKE